MADETPETQTSLPDVRIPPPPRWVDHKDPIVSANANGRAIANYLFDTLYRQGIYEGELLQRSQQSTAGTIDPEELPDPETSTLAQAQETANQAYTLAATTAARFVARGTILVSDAATTGASASFAAQSDTNYNIAIHAISNSGAAAAGAYTIKGVAKTTTGFTITLVAAPGAGTSVTFDYAVLRVN